MAGGLIALLDDVAALAKAASASLDDIAAGASRASTKTLGVIIDDAAVTPQYVGGLRPSANFRLFGGLPRVRCETRLCLFSRLRFFLQRLLRGRFRFC